MRIRDVAVKLTPNVLAEVRQHEEYIKDEISGGGIKRFILNRAWPTLVDELTNSLEAVIRLVVKEFSRIPMGQIFDRIAEIEKDPLRFATDTADDFIEILESMQRQFVRDAGSMSRRALLGICWRPVLRMAPRGVAWGLKHVFAEFKEMSEFQLASMVEVQARH